MSGRTKSWTWIALAATLIVVVGAAVVVYVRRGGARPPRPGEPRYEQIVSAFSAGVAALDTDANEIARDLLARATELGPEEPAAWANRGLAAIRLGKLEEADEYLARARALAPESGAIERFSALLDDRRNQPETSIEHLRRAIELDPKGLRARYSLAQQLENQGGDEAEVVRALGELLALRPENLAVLLDRARVAAKAGDGATLADTVRRLAPLSAAWPERAQTLFRALEQGAAGANVRAAAPRVVVLRNVLVTLPAFRHDLAAIQDPVGTVGTSITAFLRLTPLQPSPAPSDLDLTFAIAPPGPAPATPASALVVVPDAREGPALLLAVDGKEVRRADGQGVVSPFPGGPAAVPASAASVVVADWSSDEAMDLVLAGAGGVRFLRRQADGSFADATAATGLGPEALAADAFGAWAADIEMDGDLDVVLAARGGPTLALVNHGDGTFEVARPFAGSARLRGFAWADLDRDGDPDAATIDDAGRLRVYTNERAGRFAERPVPADIAPVSALVAADADGDGTVDLVLLGPGSIHRLSDREEGKAWESVALLQRDGGGGEPAQVDRAGDARLLVADLDNNGAIDLIVSSTSPSTVWLGSGPGRPWAVLKGSPAMRTFAAVDLNGDGRLDLAGLTGQGAPALGTGQGTKDYRWLVVRPRAAKASGDGRINTFGVGGEVQVRAGLLVQTQVIGGPSVHFGLGGHAVADVARVLWPNGTVQAEFNTQTNREVVALQRLKGSCPFIYAFDGTDVRFVTDFLWRSPLGLRINAQDTGDVTQTEDWIKIRGDQLAPRDGYYDIRLTAELWETHFWDHVSLMVVDHPEGTHVHVDERFARQPPALAVHATGRPVPVASARDERGDDVTERVRARDGRYVDEFELTHYQGLAKEHWIEVELGADAPTDRPLVLVGEGWVHPTDSSINLAIGQGRHDAPRGLSLEVPDEKGGWKVVHGDLGFPSGKAKTILVGLDGVFRPGQPRRFRLRTNLEVYWDALSVATVEPPTTLKTSRIAASAADLRYRGFSLMTKPTDRSPELPRYDVLDGTAQRWNDLIGFYTRFGDVLELLAKVDDRYVIANAGDEVAFRFPAPAPPPPGWARDFVLIGDGWNKDGDYNTGFSKTVLPLPTHARAAYDTPPGDLEDDPVHREHAEDWRQYHTRYVTPRVFQAGLRPRLDARP